MVKRDIPQRRAADRNHRWQSAENITRIVSIVFLAWITYLTKVSSDNASIAASAARNTAEVVVKNDSVKIAALDSIHNLVDGTKSALDTLVFDLQVHNTALRQQLRTHGIVPREPQRRVNP